MKAIGIFIIILIGINAIPYLNNREFKIVKKNVKIILIPLFIISMGTFILSIYGLKLKGYYWYKFLGISSIGLSILYLSIETKVVNKVIANVAFLPLFVIGLYQTVLYNKVGSYEISKKHNIVCLLYTSPSPRD